MPIYENPHTGRTLQFSASPGQRCLFYLLHGVAHFQEQTGATDAGVIHMLGYSLKNPPCEVARILCESEWSERRFKKALKQYYAANYPQPPDQPLGREAFKEQLRQFKALCAKRKVRLAHVALINQHLNQQPR